jgi:hypothetical protein
MVTDVPDYGLSPRQTQRVVNNLWASAKRFKSRFASRLQNNFQNLK